MAFVVADRVKELTTTLGTGTVTLTGAAAGYQSFSAIGNNNQTFYTIAHQTASEWEVGIGTYTSSGTTLSRSTVLSSSNSGSLVNFSVGTKDVFVTYPSQLVPILQTVATISTSITFAPTNRGLSQSPTTITSPGSVRIPGGQFWQILQTN
jgi:hypothetical protein